MPVFLLLIGVLLIVVAIQGNTTYMLTLVKSDVLGPQGFIMWILAVVIIVSVGYIKPVRPIADAFLGLLILVIIVAAYKNKVNLFQSFADQLHKGVTEKGNCGAPPANSGGGGGGILGTGLSLNDAATVAKVYYTGGLA